MNSLSQMLSLAAERVLIAETDAQKEKLWLDLRSLAAIAADHSPQGEAQYEALARQWQVLYGHLTHRELYRRKRRR